MIAESSAPVAATVVARAAPLAPPTVQQQTALVFTRDRDAEGVIRQCLSTLIPSAEFINGTVDAAITQLAQRASPRLLIVDITGSVEPTVRIQQLAGVCEPETGVIVIGDVNDIRLYRELRQIGISEYFYKPLVSALVTRTASRILTGGTEQQGSSLGKLIVVIGVRGGVGSTTIITSAAWHLAETNRRRVALIDLDLYAGDAALQLDTAPTHALCEALENPARVDDLFIERATIRVTERLSLMSSMESLTGGIVPTEESVLSLAGKMLRRYRYVFVDMPLSLAPRLLRVLHLPGICLLVSNSTLVSTRDLARWRELVGPSTTERRVLHILNKAGAAGGLPPADFLRAAAQPPDITIPYDRNITVASSMGVKGVINCASLQNGLLPLYSIIAGEPMPRKHSFGAGLVDRLLHRS